MRVRIVAVGKIKDKPVRELLRDYYGRIDRYGRLEEIELRDGDEAEVTARFRKAIPERSRVVAMEVLGKQPRIISGEGHRAGQEQMGRLPHTKSIEVMAEHAIENFLGGAPPEQAID